MKYSELYRAGTFTLQNIQYVDLFCIMCSFKMKHTHSPILGKVILTRIGHYGVRTCVMLNSISNKMLSFLFTHIYMQCTAENVSLDFSTLTCTLLQLKDYLSVLHYNNHTQNLFAFSVSHTDTLPAFTAGGASAPAKAAKAKSNPEFCWPCSHNHPFQDWTIDLMTVPLKEYNWLNYGPLLILLLFIQ